MSTATETREVEITDVGPIKSLRIPIPADGGLIVLRARNGRGKSKALESVESLVGGKSKLEPRDRCLKGRVSGLGAEITVSRSRATRKGSDELEVTSLAGRLSVNDLVDPGIANAEAADAHRIKALVQIAGVEASPDLFYDLTDGKEAFPKIDLDGCDLLTMAARVKRSFEALSRSAESAAEQTAGKAAALRESAKGVDVEQVCDPVALQASLEEAIWHEADLKAKSESARKATEQARAALDAMEDAQAEYVGCTIEEGELELQGTAVALKDAEQSQQLAVAALREAEKAVAATERGVRAASDAVKLAIHNRDSAQNHAKLIAGWQKQIEAAQSVQPIEQAALDSAHEGVVGARSRVELGALIRKARTDLEAAKKAEGEAEIHRQVAGELREAAAGTDGVLTSCVAKAGSPLRVESGRLVLDTSRGTTLFADLSAGERWRIALDLAIDAGGDDCLHVICQEAYEGLDPVARREISEHLKARGAVAITAECSDGEQVTAEVFG